MFLIFKSMILFIKISKHQQFLIENFFCSKTTNNPPEICSRNNKLNTSNEKQFYNYLAFGMVALTSL